MEMVDGFGAMGGRHEHVPKARGPRLGFQLLDELDHLPAIARLLLFLVAGFIGIDMLVHESAEPLQHFLATRGIVELHVGLVLPALGWRDHSARKAPGNWRKEGSEAIDKTGLQGDRKPCRFFRHIEGHG